MKKKTCKGCGSATKKLSYAGPRCLGCHRDKQAASKKAAHEAYVLKTYGLKAGEYDKIHEGQGGKCFICNRYTGKTKKLAVDHDHKTGYVRGLLCSTCNKILGHFRDDPIAGARIVEYLTYPPAQDIVGMRKPE